MQPLNAPTTRQVSSHVSSDDSPDGTAFADQAELLALACGLPAALIALLYHGRFEVVGQVGYVPAATTIDVDDELVRVLGRHVSAPTVRSIHSPLAETAGVNGLIAHGGICVHDENGATIGVIVISSCRPRRFGEAQRRAVELVAARVSSASALQHEVATQAAQLDELGQSNAELLGWSTRDPLTGLANRKALMDALDRATTGEHIVGVLGVLFLDIDNFKAVNDTFGHQFGDAVLIAVGQRMRSVVRGSDCVARLGGDEFVVVSVDTDSSRLHALAERVEHALAGPIVHGHHSVRVHVSIGVAIASEPSDTADELLRRADAHMYRVKHERQIG